MKKSVWILAVAVSWILWTLPVKADVIWEPYNDNFYMDNSGDCEYINRSYTANGPDGEVIVYKSPENPTVVTTWENGFTAHIYYVYTDKKGNEWGIYEDHQNNISGWVPMAYMTVVYDYICFQEEFAERITEESGAIPAMYAGQTVNFWSYPGSQNSFTVNLPEEAEALPQYSSVFVDDEGNQWGYIGYFRGIRHCWVCLANATGSFYDIYPNGAPEVGKQDADDTQESEEIVPGEDSEPTVSAEDEETEEDRIEPEKDNGLIGLVIGLVVAVSGATGGALVWLKKGKK